MPGRQNIQFTGHPSLENEFREDQSNAEDSENSSLIFFPKIFQVDADPV